MHCRLVSQADIKAIIVIEDTLLALLGILVVRLAVQLQ